MEIMTIYCLMLINLSNENIMKKKYFYILFLCISCLGITNSIQGQGVMLRTPKGHTVYAFERSEFTVNEINSINQQYIRQYPNATLVASASNTYNCHSYAWNMTEGGVTC
jgi:hypothetical protein